MKKTKFPKRAKLITDGGFYRIINISGFVEKINVPLTKRIKFCSPEMNEIDLKMSVMIEFMFERTTKTMATYRQTNVISEVK